MSRSESDRARATIRRVKRLLIAAALTALAACASGPTDGPPRAGPSASAAGSAPARGGAEQLLPVGRGARVFVGRLTENQQFSNHAPLEYCLEDGQRYLGAPHRLGSVNLAGKHDLTANDLGLVVVAYGTERPLLELLQSLGACPVNYGDGSAQPYTSSISPEGGFRARRSTLEKLSYIEAQSARVVTLHEVVENTSSSVVVRIFNPFERPLHPEARARYEGNVAQPMNKAVPILAPIAPGGHVDSTLDKRTEQLVNGPYGDRTARLLLESVELSLYRPEIRIEASLLLEVR